MISKADFCTYIKEYEPAIYAVAYSIVRNEHDAGDAIGEAILKAYANLDTLRDAGAFKPWILRIVHNEAVELLRKHRPAVDIEEAHHLATGDSEAQRTEKLDLKAAVESLPQPYRTVITLYYYEHMTTADIAEITGASPLAIRKQLSRGRNMLRQTLKEDYLDE